MASLLAKFSQHRMDRDQIASKGFGEFVKRAWSHVDSSPFTGGWHIDAMSEHLTAVYNGDIYELVINIPPSMGKSLLVSVLWPAWVWTKDPTYRWIGASYDDTLTLRDSRRMRALVGGDWYRRCWPEITLPRVTDASRAISLWYNTSGGLRYSTTIRAGLTGHHGDCAVVDDPHKPSDTLASSGVEIKRVLTWYSETLPTRFRDPKKAKKVCVMQRLHERDLAGEMARMGATVLCMPMRYASGHPHRYTRDPRTQDGQLLCPARYDEAAVRRLETTLGRQAAAQLGQWPVPLEGGLFKRESFKYWVELPQGGTWSQSWDLAFKDSATSSYVVGQVWYQCGPNFYLVDQWRGHAGFSATIDAIKSMSIRYPRAHRKLIEDKANGPAVVDVLRRDVPGLELVSPEGGKIARANAVEPLVASGNVFLPDPDKARYPDGRVGARWVIESAPGDPSQGGWLGEVTTFPNAGTDDQVDTMTQFLNYAGGSYTEKLKQTMKDLPGLKARFGI